MYNFVLYNYKVFLIKYTFVVVELVQHYVFFRIQFCKVEIDENPVLVEKYVPDRSFPCLVIMKNGKVLGRKYGVDLDTEAEPLLRDWLKKFVP